MAISKRLRFEVLRRDNHTCRYCGRSAPEAKLTIDHVVPEALGGRDEAGNLVTACSDCNGGKTSIAPDSPLVADVAEDALRWGRAIAASAEQMLADHDARQEAYDQFLAHWNEWGKQPLPATWERSVDAFLAAGLPMPILLKCIDKAMANTKVYASEIFRYMCGIAWSRVNELQEAAKKIMAPSEASASADDDPEHSLAVEVISEANGDEQKAALHDAKYDFFGNELDSRARDIAAATSLVCTIAYDRRKLAVIVRRVLDALPPGVVEHARTEVLAEHAKAYGEDAYISGVEFLRRVADKALDSAASLAVVNV